MASSLTSENPTQNKPCRCAEGDKNIWTAKASENSDNPPQNCPNCQILKSGTLFLASKGIGWTSWKKRWFVLTRTSLVFYRNDPSALPQKGGEANPTLGGIDLNTSGSVVVKADKKLLTVLFPDGRDGRTFTLKAETSEELQEWKTALENALAQAPSAANVMGQNGILRNEIADSVEVSGKDKRPVQSMVIGRPVLLALEEIDGSPSFLEKALRFIEDYGIKVEGILRQSADVEEVERRVQEYEQGKVEFSAEEDAHVIGDCIKHVLRELPSSPVPASCCTALVEAYRTGRGNRLNAIRAAIAETFPDPNRRLLQRILKMMRTVASHRSENRMSSSGLAACMAPLLLRPLLAGDCEFEDDFNMGGDGSIQLLKAAAAANHAQAIVIILLEDYDRIFDEELLHDGSSSEIYTDSEEEVDDDNEDEDDGEDDDDDDDDVDDTEDDFSTDNDIAEVGGYCDAQNGVEADIEDDFTDSSCGTLSRSVSDIGSVSSDNKSIEDYSTDSSSPKDTEATDRQSSSLDIITLQKDTSENQSTDELTTKHADLKDSVSLDDSNSKISASQEDSKSFGDLDTPTSQMQKCSSHNPTRISKFHEKSMDSMSTSRRHARWGRAPARKNLSMESMDVPSEDKDAIQRLETIKDDLQDKLAEEVKENALLQASLERRKEALHSRQSALEKEVERLRELLQKERDLRATLESQLTNRTMEDLEETNLAEADIKNLKQKVAELREQLNLHALCESCNKRLHAISQSEEINQQKIGDSPLLQQSINSSKLDIGSSTVSSEEFRAQIDDPSSTDGEIPQRGPPEQTNQTSFSGYSGLPSTEESSCIGATGVAKFSSTDGSTLSKASLQDVKPESQNISCLLSSQHEKEKLSTKKNRRKSLESESMSYRQEPTEVVKISAPDTFTSKDENSTSGDDRGSAKARTQDSHSSADRRPSKDLLSITVACDSSKKSTSRGENSRTRGDHENAKAKTEDSHPSGDGRPSKNPLPREDPVTVVYDSPKNASSRGENSKAGEDHENVKAKIQDSIPSGDRQPSKEPLPREEPARVACDSPRKATSRGENSMSGEDHENAKAKTQDLPPSGDRRPSKNILLPEGPATVPCDSTKKSTLSGENSMSGEDHESGRAKTQDSYASAADWLPSKNELPHEEPAQVSCDSSKSTSRNENPKIGLEAEKFKAQSETPVSSVDKQSFKQPPNTTNQGSKKPVLSQNLSVEEQLAFNRIGASKKTKTWDEMLKEPPHSPSLQKRKPSQKLQPYTSGINNSVKPVGSPEDAAVGSSAGLKKPTGPKPEEAPPTSSTALTRLTNRLNFLKERRVQLVSELQNLDVNRASGPEHPPSNTR